MDTNSNIINNINSNETKPEKNKKQYNSCCILFKVIGKILIDIIKCCVS